MNHLSFRTVLLILGHFYRSLFRSLSRATDRMELFTYRRCGYLACVIVMAFTATLTGCAQLNPRFPAVQSGGMSASNAAPGSGAVATVADATTVNPVTQAVQQSGYPMPGGVSHAIHSAPLDGQNAINGLVAQTAAIDEPYVARQYPNQYSGQSVPQPPQPGYTLGTNQPYTQPAPVPLVDSNGYAVQPNAGGNPYSAEQYPSEQYPQGGYLAEPPPPVVNSTTTFPPTQFGPRTVQPQPSTIPGLGPAFPPIGTDPVYSPNVRVADLIVNGFPARTGRIMFGAAVNSDAGVTGQITVDERNFDITRWPRSFRDLLGGTAFRGAGETFRLEMAPGSQFDRYSAQWATPNLLGYLPLSFSVSGFLYDRRFRDWDENRLGMRTSLGYRITPDLSLSVGISGQRVKLDDARATVPDGGGGLTQTPILADAVGRNELYSGLISLTHNTRDSPIQPSSGHYFQLSFEEVFGDFDYSKIEAEYRKYWLLTSRADNSGKQTLSYSTQLGFSGNDTPIFENFFAGGYATIRGFDFRGASPVVDGIEAGGRFQWLNSVEYMFPITADDAFRGVTFVDFGTVEQDIELNSDSFRVAPGAGLRVAIPALGPAPLAFDFAFPVAMADTDDKRIFSFYMSVVR
ncbi:BamA/OMP85 family outer membrane protein [Stieleria varia]|uniref:Outer membrane protein assembly factor YaeT n=1 Tax=Stieleria varia TaxID=2528005 RepID=A0A5C6B5B3_9BACT|nr:BamA/TamA family outer membrane protein [Stieleria varia]TWU05664.1 outer membrane protein assembly factor YaeT [Stieleria varia]